MNKQSLGAYCLLALSTDAQPLDRGSPAIYLDAGPILGMRYCVISLRRYSVNTGAAKRFSEQFRSCCCGFRSVRLIL